MRIKTVFLFVLLTLFTTKLVAQEKGVTLSGNTKDNSTKAALPFVNVVLKTSKDTSIIAGTITNEEGRFSLANIKSGNYILEFSFIGYKTKTQSVYVGGAQQMPEIFDPFNAQSHQSVLGRHNLTCQSNPHGYAASWVGYRGLGLPPRKR